MALSTNKNPVWNLNHNTIQNSKASKTNSMQTEQINICERNVTNTEKCFDNTKQRYVRHVCRPNDDCCTLLDRCVLQRATGGLLLQPQSSGCSDAVSQTHWLVTLRTRCCACCVHRPLSVSSFVAAVSLPLLTGSDAWSFTRPHVASAEDKHYILDYVYIFEKCGQLIAHVDPIGSIL